MTEYRPLGRTDLRVSSIALGTMTWGEQNTEAEGHAQLDLALDQGINFIDTAESYSIPPRAETQGSTETIIGNWFKARGNRDRVILASKVAGPSERTWLRDDGSYPRLDARNINEAIDKSLRRLQTDYIDLYQLHWPNRVLPLFGNAAHAVRGGIVEEVPIEETLEALDALVKAGKVRHIGLSNETAWGLSRFLHLSETRNLPRVVSVQNAFNLLNRTYEGGLSEFHAREQVGLLAYSPLAQGFLTGKYQNGARPAGARLTLFDRGGRYQKPGTEEALSRYLAIARDFGLDPAQFAIAWVTSRPFVTSNIIGATSIEQLKSNLASQELTITPEIEERVDAVFQLHGSPAP
ncbi:aldo/keto reductase [Pseudochelatococcus contaminans]|uniref:Protein tas n=1 Tax=Pseudochelatococcus contaminans TaxID=1538103 RepID=A0A7W5Z5Z4_9HYPH|nr:aldo/keto reductase [Pseudochelatococcus contaminans]MBB3810450.1 aryl-alcohol dehydrogenase-like predicted oxidoreductase [Pseudochelatococcus contaminans]